ncbi:hypothetical protein OPV22_034493 [Ensete ventricosum]|uniref:Uncharacterized protein n=1 Tax=Ensete ventricosum TaxID=4639 RepID=A0AAV8PSN0_ENSVE|nr:hypothetical protein OPV22_034493 [Ensete ventricosum]
MLVFYRCHEEDPAQFEAPRNWTLETAEHSFKDYQVQGLAPLPAFEKAANRGLLLLYRMVPFLLRRELTLNLTMCLWELKVNIERYGSMYRILWKCNDIVGTPDVWRLLDDTHDLRLTLYAASMSSQYAMDTSFGFQQVD